MIDKEITKYDIAYRDVLCTGVKWRYPENNIFYFTKDGKNYEFEQKYYIDNQSADTDHIRCVIVDQFLPWWKNERIKELESENATLRERLEKAVELPRIIHPNKNEWFIQYQLKSGIIDYNIRYSKEAAEARLAELKGE